MKHPEEDLISSLYGELADGDRARLESHLRECEACRQKREEWQGTARLLDHWKVERVPVSRAPSLLPWAIAASLLLALGFLAGTWLLPESVRAAQSDRLRQEGQSLRNEVRADLARMQEKMESDLRAEITRSWESLNDDSLVLASTQFQEQLNNLLEQLRDAQADDRKSTLALLDQVQKQLSDQVVNLRRDLETVAVSAENRIHQTQTQIGELALASNQQSSDPDIKP